MMFPDFIVWQVTLPLSRFRLLCCWSLNCLLRATTSALLCLLWSRSESCLVEVYELDESHVSSVTLTETSLQHASVSTWTVSDLWSNSAEELCNSLLILEVAEYNTTRVSSILL